MNTDFEPVMSALFSSLQAALSASFPTMSRRLKFWSDVSAQPALFLRRIGVSDQNIDGLYITTTLECELWIYSKAGANPDVAPDTALGQLEQAVRAAFAPDADYGDPRFTIGGLVYWCRIEGRTDASPGDIGPQAIARIPVRITLP